MDAINLTLTLTPQQVQAQVDAINVKQKQILDQQLVEKREKRQVTLPYSAA